MLTGVAARLSSLREERPSAGTKYRLMGMVADITEVTEQLSKEVLERVKQEAVLDVDVDVDFDVMAEEVLSWELTTTKEELQENTQLVNDALGGLNDVLTQIATDWAVADKRLGLKCMIVGMLKDVGVIRGSYNSISKLLDMDSENPATLAKYMGMGKKQPFAEWITNYVKG